MWLLLTGAKCFLSIDQPLLNARSSSASRVRGRLGGLIRRDAAGVQSRRISICPTVHVNRPVHSHPFVARINTFPQPTSSQSHIS